MQKSGNTHYTKVAKALHWAIAVLIIMMLVFGQGFDGLKTEEEMAFFLAGHSTLGLTVIGLIVLRILWRLGHPPPALPAGMKAAHKTAAKLSHLMLYALMVYVPLMGLYTVAAHETVAMPYGTFDLNAALSFLGDSDFEGRRFLHEIGTWGLIGFLALHVAAAFHHQFILKDGVLRRMWFGGGKPEASE